MPHNVGSISDSSSTSLSDVGRVNVLINAEDVSTTAPPHTLSLNTTKSRQAAWAVFAIIVLLIVLGIAVWKNDLCTQVDDFRSTIARSRVSHNSEPLTIGSLLKGIATGNSHAQAAHYSRLATDGDDEDALPTRF